MRLNTASEVISLSRRLEEEGAALYEKMARQRPDQAEHLAAFARENSKFVTQVERAYYGVISDALEGGFAFDLETDGFEIGTDTAGAVAGGDVKAAVAMEERMIRFYEEAAEQSQSLMADVPRAFRLVVKKRRRRLESLNALL
jgi:hypothetical protein